MCIYDYVKNHIGTFQDLSFDVRKGYKQMTAPNSCETYCSLQLAWHAALKTTK